MIANKLYLRWSRNQDVVLRQDHKAGEKMFVDWADFMLHVKHNLDMKQSFFVLDEKELT